jgi:hypothetical protein
MICAGAVPRGGSEIVVESIDIRGPVSVLLFELYTRQRIDRMSNFACGVQRGVNGGEKLLASVGLYSRRRILMPLLDGVVELLVAVLPELLLLLKLTAASMKYLHYRRQADQIGRVRNQRMQA